MGGGYWVTAEPANWLLLPETKPERRLAAPRSPPDRTFKASEDAMKRIVISAALASAAMLSAAQAQTIGTATTDLNVRSGPDPQFPVIDMIREGRRASVIGCIEGSRWCQVDIRGRTGWAYSQYLMMSGDVVAVLPVPELEVEMAARPVFSAPAPVVAYGTPAPAVTYQTPFYRAPAPVVAYNAPPVVTYRAPAVTYQEPVVAYGTAPAVTYQAPPPVVAYRAPATTTLVGTTGVAPRDFAGRLIPPRETIYASTNLPRAYVPPRSVRTYIAANPLETVWLEGSLMVGAGLIDGVETVPVPGSRYDYAYVNDYAVLVDPGTRRIVYVSR
jgi:uncharacterized protein YraI